MHGTLVIAALLLAAAPATSPREDVLHLFVSGEGGYGRYRIPALYVTPKKTVLALCEGRVKAGGLTGDIDIVIRRSTDGGATWLPLQVVADDGPNTLGNPCPVVDRSTGTIWLPFTRSLGQDTEDEIVEGKSDARTQVWLTHSADEGETWAKPIDISSQASKANWTWYGTGPGFGLQLASGRLLIPSYHAVAGSGIYQAHSLMSDDHGRSWRIGGMLADETTEPQVALRQDGSITMNARNINPRDASVRKRMVGTSRDGGDTWTDAGHDATLADSSCEASLLVYSGLGDEERSRWLFANPPGPGRNHLTLRLSYDEGRSWPQSLLVEPGNSEYSSLARLPDDSIGILYERSTNPKKYSVEIVLARIQLAEIEAGK